MKGKQLTLEEVLDLEDGSKVWVEELNARYSDWSGIHVRKQDELIAEKDEMVYEINYLDGLGEDYGLEIYEWIEEPKENFDSYINDGAICKITITKNELLSFFERNEIQIGDEYYRDYCDNDFKEKIDKLFEEFS